MAIGHFKDAGFERDVKKLFASLPKSMQHRSVSRIYVKALRRLQRAIRSNAPIASGVHKFRGKTFDPGSLKKAVRVTALKPGTTKDPAAMVFVSRSYTRGAVWGLWLEYGVSKRERGSVPQKPFFRPAVDANKNGIRRDIEKAMKRYAQRELDKQVNRWNKKASKMMYVNL